MSRKYSVFTALLLSYVIFVFLAYDVWTDNFNPAKATALAFAALLIAGAIAKFTNRLLGRPLEVLREGITSVRHGRLEPVPVSRTGDEIEFLGESLNAMIRALGSSQAEIREYQESLEERIRQRTKALERASQTAMAASRAKSEFLANMSHELRTPMSGVLGMIDILLDDNKLDQDQREHLVTAKGCAITLLSLLNDILDLSKIEAGKMVLEEIPYDIRSLLADCLKSMKIRTRAKGISLRSRVVDGVPATLSGDPLRLRQIISNLLSNAVKFTDKGSVEVTVETASNDERLIIEVTDTGPGIASDKLPNIFDEFTQADGSISRRYGGTGLGLAITRKLALMHGGDIEVSSELGRGSTFRVTLPCTPVEANRRKGPGQAASAGQQPVVPELTGQAILVVEDNLVNQRVVKAMLQRHGYRVEIANHGGEVLEALERTPVSLVLMDIQMPVVDGLEATRTIRSDERFRNLPVVAMTAHAMHGDRDLCLQHGMDGYISKPVTRPRLLAVVEKHLLDHAHANGKHRSAPVAGEPARLRPAEGCQPRP